MANMNSPDKALKDKQSVTVVGGGPVGALQAVLLAKSGFRVDLYESRPDIRSVKRVTGMSINFALSTRGTEALKAVGLEDVVVNSAVPMYGRMIHSVSGKMTARLYSKVDSSGINRCIYSVNRRKLNGVLLNEAERHPNITLHFDHKLVRADLSKKSLTFSTAEGVSSTVNTDFIFGCDGAHSTVRRQMMHAGRMDFQQEYTEHGYKELIMPPDANGEFAFPPKYFHMWPRNEFMMIALPNKDCSFTVTLLMPFTVFESIKTKEELLAFFSKYFPDTIEKLGVENLVKDFFRNPTGSFISVKCYPHFMAGSTVILGDAAHAVVPFYAQGMNAGLEDCLIFCEILTAEGGDLVRAGERYSSSHWKDCHAIADLSKYNYLEIRSHVNTRVFLVLQFIDKLLSYLMPSVYIPLYTMVTFTRIPYHQVVQRNHRQQRVVMATFKVAGMMALVGFGGVVLMWSGAYTSLRYRVIPCFLKCVMEDFKN